VKLAIALLLVPSLALADVPPPAPLTLQNEPTSPIAAQTAGGYSVLPALPDNPSHTRKLAGGVTLAAGVALGVIGVVLLATRPSSGSYDANVSHDMGTVEGIMALGAGTTAMIVGGALLGWPDTSYGELPGAPLLTF
jgi:hypothetical protein